MDCKRCATAVKPMTPLVFRFGDFLRRGCDCSITYAYHSKVKVINTKKGHIKIELPG